MAGSVLSQALQEIKLALNGNRVSLFILGTMTVKGYQGYRRFGYVTEQLQEETTARRAGEADIKSLIQIVLGTQIRHEIQVAQSTEPKILRGTQEAKSIDSKVLRGLREARAAEGGQDGKKTER